MLSFMQKLLAAAALSLSIQTGSLAATLFDTPPSGRWIEQDANGDWFVVVERRSDGDFIGTERYYLMRPTVEDARRLLAVEPIPPSPPPAPNPVPQPEPADKPPFRVAHPRIYKVIAPARWSWNAAVWVGVKTEPIHPFLNLLGACGSMATPFTTGFRGR